MANTNPKQKVVTAKLVFLGKFTYLLALVLFTFSWISKLLFIILGHSGVGKTSLVLRFTENEYVDNSEPTIGGW